MRLSLSRARWTCPGHAPAAAAADQDAGKKINGVLLRRGAGIQPMDALYQIKVLPGDNGLAGIGDLHPLGGRTQLPFLDFIWFRAYWQ